MAQSAGVENMKGAEKVHVPPIKTQGVVGFNLAPRRALFSDTNVHIIDFYRSIQDGQLTAAGCRKFLESEGARLKSRGVFL